MTTLSTAGGLSLPAKKSQIQPGPQELLFGGSSPDRCLQVLLSTSCVRLPQRLQVTLGPAPRPTLPGGGPVADLQPPPPSLPAAAPLPAPTSRAPVSKVTRRLCPALPPLPASLPVSALPLRRVEAARRPPPTPALSLSVGPSVPDLLPPVLCRSVASSAHFSLFASFPFSDPPVSPSFFSRLSLPICFSLGRSPPFCLELSLPEFRNNEDLPRAPVPWTGSHWHPVSRFWS